ncbi:hypothetical protein [Denitrobaculum tricleocarpae]|uniref:Zf-HC2 domain-containing protein n=1 Tax=Denitrobaculum tricleocarpae TaxID=2591009 RepID=A0A545SXZ4_9PROT|nr:hypothetical protein [Denitrobaculum tricleocarpae]TQV69838.1 hypothetical protein FKG95_28585 [Denitrobaculum tricleocarpae]
MTEQKSLSDHELMKLLPFYVNLTLDPLERASVENYLARSEEARKEVDYLKQLRKSLKAQPEATSPGELGLKRLQREIKRMQEPPEGSETEAVPAAASERSADPAALRGQRFSDSAQKAQESAGRKPVPAWWRSLAVAACLALAVISSVTLSTQFGNDGSPQLASGESGTVLQVTFKPQITEEAIRSLLLETDLTITAGPSALGVYHLTPGSSADSKNLEETLRELRLRSDIIESAEAG